ncbi:3' terminal RNA ribose 2'-O-methyltransferase Hen1 [Actinokineospora pegani]|uniref:3' terminal RNA ribose 2'-O-methyltransferase Hen1 n=1 Tax=Actinokineospora pegani TaxID=2654637 RepID=UPI0012EAA6C9|nr:3' terminal RNA ribose 2'-O-methyltransferase Hen1 [Actinokineospora pegani]
MLLTLTTTHTPATDLSHLLFKHPDNPQSFDTSVGVAHVFYPRADEDECTVALLLEVDPVALARGKGDKRQTRTLSSYVNDRPYAAGSMLSVALGKVFGTAMTGRGGQRQQVADAAMPLRVALPAAACRGGVALAERLFTPLGWAVEAAAVPLDPEFPEWGESDYLDLVLIGRLRLADALRQLYVLLPVMDGSKHYRIDESEVDKLVRAGGSWLPAHPERDLISARYLDHRHAYVATALDRLSELDASPPPAQDEAEVPAERTPLAAVRRQVVRDELRALGARRVLDLGCGRGALLLQLAEDPAFTEVVGVDVSAAALRIAAKRVDKLPDRVRSRVAVRQSSLVYGDATLAGYDAAVLVEVVEHIDPGRLPAMEQAVFGTARPAHVLVTTPNVEHNALFEGLAEGALRHDDHRFEWTRAQFREWAGGVAERSGYTVRHVPIGPDDPVHGPPTQLAVFSRAEA